MTPASPGPFRPLQSVVVPAACAEPLVDGFRERGDWARGVGVPAHITLAGRWSPDVVLPRRELSELAAAIVGTRYRLDRVGLLGDAVCLLADDDEPLVGLRGRVLAAAGVPDPWAERWRPHLTVYRRAPARMLQTVTDTLGPRLPIDCEVESVQIARLLSSGRVEFVVL